MLYPTHKKYGILWGLLMIPISVGVGFIPTISKGMEFTDLLLVVLTVYIGMRGALFGARFPDIDSHGSIPAQRHPILRRVFEFFNVKHRGKYSHDFISIGATFGIIYLLVHILGNKLLQHIAEGGHDWLYTVIYLVGLAFVYMIGNDIVEFLQYTANLQHNKRMWVKLQKNKFFISTGVAGVLALGLVVTGTVNLGELITFNIPMSSALLLTTMFLACLKVYVIFTLAGAYSHLVADMTTKSGVSIFGKKLAPMQVILKLKKIPIIGVLLVPTEFKTGSKWEDFVNLVVTLLCIPAGVLAFFVVFGYDVSSIVEIVQNR